MTIGLTGVPALTLQQPWGTAISHGPKRVENRSWSAPEHVSRLLIHAGKGWDHAGTTRLRELDLFHLIDHAVRASGAIVAVADLAHVCGATVGTGCLCNCGPWAVAGQYHWNLTDVRPLHEPVPCRGTQRLWYPPADVVEAVTNQFASTSTRSTP